MLVLAAMAAMALYAASEAEYVVSCSKNTTQTTHVKAGVNVTRCLCDEGYECRGRKCLHPTHAALATVSLSGRSVLPALL